MTQETKQLRGYTAAFIQIESLLDHAEKKRPKRLPVKARKSAAFREGYYEGLAAAHCFSALGDYPETNSDIISRVLAKVP